VVASARVAHDFAVDYVGADVYGANVVGVVEIVF